MENPFAEGENRILKPPATAVVIFGASGDLTHRKLIPALYNLCHDDYLPAGFLVIGVSRTKMTDQVYRDDLFAAVSKHSRRKVTKEVWDKFAANIFYQSLDASKPADFTTLKKRLEELCVARTGSFNYLYYLATSPTLFGGIASNLKVAGLVERPTPGGKATSLIVEKPFGHDVASARELNHTLRSSFEESQIFRIDHYLGKETVQNILVFRFANGIFEPLWNQKYVDHIQISVCENIGVENRAEYFEKSGITRDIIQNHLLQVLSLLCIEPPLSLSDADSIRDEKVKVLKSIRRFTAADVHSKTVRGQYSAGFIDGQAVASYNAEKGVSPSSQTETFSALKLEIDNWRWAGVPIYVRAGKRLPKRITEITIYFKSPPKSLFRGRPIDDLEQNILAIQIQPNEGISLKVNSKPPGPRMRVRPVVMDFAYSDSFGVPSPEAYERLLLDAMKGEATLFTRDDEIEEAWDILQPIFAGWADPEESPLHEYDSGTWGPKAAATLLKPNHRWRRL